MLSIRGDIKQSPLENKLLGDLIREWPATSEIMKRHFGENCFCRVGLRITTLETACILYGVDLQHLIQELKGSGNQ